MAEKAVVMRVTDIQRIDALWRLTVAARVTKGDEGHSVEVLATAIGNNFTDPAWRSRLIEAVIHAARNGKHALEIDEVMFGDFSVPGA